MVQTSDTTWQGQPLWRGSSIALTASRISNAGTVSRALCERATKVSQPASTAPRRDSFVFNAEYPMVRWLEANGYNVKYQRRGHRALNIPAGQAGALSASARSSRKRFSVGHDEHWSAGQRASVEAARSAGVSLAFFSGNEIYWKAAGSTPTARRTGRS